MVAYTTDFCLPYFDGTDSPCVDTGGVCTPSTVWCDMAQIIDNAFTTFDSEIARAADSFPYAQVAVSDIPFTVDSGASNFATQLVIWDTAVGDSDGMVNLTTDPSTINLRRSGIWNLHCITVWRSSVNDTHLTTELLNPGSPQFTSFNVQFNDVWVEPIPGSADLFGPALGLSNIMDGFFRVDASTGPVPLQIQLQVFAAGGGIVGTVEVCRFSARWVADLP